MFEQSRRRVYLQIGILLLAFFPSLASESVCALSLSAVLWSPFLLLRRGNLDKCHNILLREYGGGLYELLYYTKQQKRAKV